MNVVQTILDFPLVPVYYHPDIEQCRQVMDAAYVGGVRAFEYTNRGENALMVFSQLKKLVLDAYPDLVLGIGTIFTANEALQFIDAGADFVVQPFTSSKVAEVCLQNNIPWIPGTLTPTEMHQALELGASMLKLFPGNALGSSYLKSIRGPLPHVKIMVTGGVAPTLESTSEWFAAGANALGLGSQLFKETHSPEKISQTLELLFNLNKP